MATERVLAAFFAGLERQYAPYLNTSYVLLRLTTFYYKNRQKKAKELK